LLAGAAVYFAGSARARRRTLLHLPPWDRTGQDGDK
jgi:hypothetical protein